MVVDGVSVDALHHQHMGGGVFPKKGGGGDEIDPLVELVEFFQIGGLGLEIHFLLSHQPHFVQYLVEIHQSAHRRVFQKLAGLLQQHNVPAHNVVNAFPLHLDHHVLPGFQHRGVGLGDGRAAQSLGVKGGKHFLQRPAVGGFHNGNHLLVGHGRHLRAQLRQRLTIFLGQNV